jgi:hypothetical protein
MSNHFPDIILEEGSLAAVAFRVTKVGRTVSGTNAVAVALWATEVRRTVSGSNAVAVASIWPPGVFTVVGARVLLLQAAKVAISKAIAQNGTNFQNLVSLMRWIPMVGVWLLSNVQVQPPNS